MPDESVSIDFEPLGRKHLPQLRKIQEQAPESARWPAEAYLAFPCVAAIADRRLAGFLVCRQPAADEMEILDLAVAAAWRRKGVASALLRHLLQYFHGNVYLEVRSNNTGAIHFYTRFGFTKVGTREKYYPDTGEDAVVMRLQSC